MIRERKNIGVVLLSMGRSKLVRVRNDGLQEVRPQCLCGLSVTGKITIVNTEKVPGAYYAINLSRRCTTKHSDKKQSLHSNVGSRLPSSSSNHSNRSIRRIYKAYTTNDKNNSNKKQTNKQTKTADLHTQKLKTKQKTRSTHSVSRLLSRLTQLSSSIAVCSKQQKTDAGII